MRSALYCFKNFRDGCVMVLGVRFGNRIRDRHSSLLPRIHGLSFEHSLLRTYPCCSDVRYSLSQKLGSSLNIPGSSSLY